MEELVKTWLEGHALSERLTALERQEVPRMATMDAAESATLQNLSWETVRARRKSILHKLGLGDTYELLRTLLEFACERLSQQLSRDFSLPPRNQSDSGGTP